MGKTTFGRALVFGEGVLSDQPTLVINDAGAAGASLATQAKSCGFRVFIVDMKTTL